MAAVDAVVPFQPMSPEACTQVVERQLGQLRDQVQIMYENVSEVTWTEDVVQLLSEQGTSLTHGLKPLVGIIRQHILAPMAESLSSHAWRGQCENAHKNIKCMFSIDVGDRKTLIVKLVPLQK
jgi:ATP-dependent Clp protease ATP-binding subunit ClpA